MTSVSPSTSTLPLFVALILSPFRMVCLRRHQNDSVSRSLSALQDRLFPSYPPSYPKATLEKLNDNEPILAWVAWVALNGPLRLRAHVQAQARACARTRVRSKQATQATLCAFAGSKPLHSLSFCQGSFEGSFRVGRLASANISEALKVRWFRVSRFVSVAYARITQNGTSSSSSAASPTTSRYHCTALWILASWRRIVRPL